MYTTLIDVQSLSEHMNDPAWVIVDCRFSLADTAVGRQQYETSHIPGAVYAHLDDDLSGPPVTDKGRHPLPTPEALRDTFGKMGIDSSKQVVAYDSANGVLASRLWWMLRYMGHEAVAVLDGGWQAWETAGLDTRSGVEENESAVFAGEAHTDWLVQKDEVASAPLLVDSRGAPRYRGEMEPLDKKAGHIPGAVNFHFEQNWQDGRYKSVDEIQEQMKELLGDTAVSEATFYCGSGVSACVNLLALAHAGLGSAKLYVGSWSEWSGDESLPVATGEQ